MMGTKWSDPSVRVAFYSTLPAGLVMRLFEQCASILVVTVAASPTARPGTASAASLTAASLAAASLPAGLSSTALTCAGHNMRQRLALRVTRVLRLLPAGNASATRNEAHLVGSPDNK